MVRRKSTEFRDGIGGRGNAHATGTAAVVILAAIQQVDVVILTHPVKFHAGVSAYGRVYETSDLARRPRSQGSKLVNAAAVNRDLRDLQVGDDVADLAGVGLHADGVGFDGDGFAGSANLHLEVEARA